MPGRFACSRGAVTSMRIVVPLDVFTSTVFVVTTMARRYHRSQLARGPENDDRNGNAPVSSHPLRPFLRSPRVRVRLLAAAAAADARRDDIGLRCTGEACARAGRQREADGGDREAERGGVEERNV